MRLFVSLLVVVAVCTALALVRNQSDDSSGKPLAKTPSKDAGPADRVDSATDPKQHEPEIPQAPKLTVRVLAAQSEGPVRVAVFNQPETFPDREKALKTLSLPATEKELVISELPAGVYAIAVFQDINNDGKLNRNLFGRPTEPYGFSQNVRGRFGPPEFEQASFEISQREHQIEIQLR